VLNHAHGDLPTVSTLEHVERDNLDRLERTHAA
jgi:hypothetical protein